MATDSNWFDDWLKHRLYRDILFRIVVWSLIASITVYFASSDVEFSGVAYLERAARSLLPVLNLVGSGAIMLSLVAMMFKDAEHVGSSSWGKNSTLGRFGGVTRRLAGDLTLWVVGSLTALLCAVTVALFQAVHLGAITSKNAIAIATMYLMFSVFLVITAILNVFVRRAEPSLTSIEPFSRILTKSWKVVLAYTLAIGFVAFRVWHARHR